MGRLDVRIVEARNLPNTETIGKPDPYVKIELENSQHKTSVCDSTLNPKWDEVFKFVVADPDSAQLELKLFDKNLVSDAFMGQYRMSIAGLTKGVVKDVWCLLQQCKANAEIHIRLLAHDFGAEPTPGQAAASPAAPAPAPAPVPAPAPQMQQQQPMMQQQQYQQQPMMQQQFQQPQYQQQQPGYPMQQQQPGYPMQQAGYPGQQPNMMQNQMNMMNQMMGGMMAGMQQGMMMNQPPSATFTDFQHVQLMGPVRRATYGPPGTNNDFTLKVNQMVQRGQLTMDGGIHNFLGDPAPNVPKHFCVWY